MDGVHPVSWASFFFAAALAIERVWKLSIESREKLKLAEYQANNDKEKADQTKQISVLKQSVGHCEDNHKAALAKLDECEEKHEVVEARLSRVESLVKPNPA